MSRSSTLPAGVAAFAGGTSPTEVEHALIVAFERLGQAQAQIAAHASQRAKLDRELNQEREQVSTLTKETRQLKAERDAQGQRLVELGSASGLAARSAIGLGRAGPAAIKAAREAHLGYTETLTKRSAPS